MAVRRIGRFFERELLAEGWKYYIIARAFGSFAFGRQPANRRLDLARIQLVELFDVGHDGSDLRRERAPFLVSNFEVRELGDFFDVGFGDRHDSVFSFQFSVFRTRRFYPCSEN